MSQLAYTCSVAGTEVRGTVDAADRPAHPITARDVTRVYDAARHQVGVGPTTAVDCSRLERSAPRQSEDLEWINRRMTPSCKAFGWSPNDIVSFDRWSCRYIGKGTVTDKHGNKTEVFNPFKSWSGTIASCADLDANAGLAIPDSTMRAVQRMAYYQADGDAANLDVNNFVCTITSLPRI
jgi:hypothetical protein